MDATGTRKSANYSELQVQLGRRIRIFREAADLSQTDVAKVIGVAKQSVSAWERGVTAPQVENIFALATLFGVEPAALFETSGQYGHSPTMRRLSAVGTAIPCVSEREAGLILTGTIDAKDANKFIASAVTSNLQAVAVTIQGRANYSKFQEGDVVVLDPDAHAEPGQMVLAAVSGEFFFRRYIPSRHASTAGAQLMAINPDYPVITMGAEDEILAVMLSHTTTRHD